MGSLQGMRFDARHGVIDVPNERLTRFLQRLEGLDGEFLSGRDDVITAIETAKDRVVLSEPQKETGFLVLELWAQGEGESALGPSWTLCERLSPRISASQTLTSTTRSPASSFRGELWPLSRAVGVLGSPTK